MPAAGQPPAVLEAAGTLLAEYDVLLVDVWGVVHDGNRAYPEANSALSRFRHRGGTVILVSNAPLPADALADLLDRKGVDRAAWDALVTSGDIAIDHCRDMNWMRLYHLGPARDRRFFAALPGRSVAINEAQAIVVTGLVDDRRETAADYRALLLEGQGCGLELVCANPDLAVHVGPHLLPCAGALGALYEDLGGRVFWAGKPYPVAYERSLEIAGRRRAGPIDTRRVLAIGDLLRTDLAAAAGAGVDALFVAGGLHRDEAMEGDRLSAAGLTRLFGPEAPPALAAIDQLRW